jgi:hypothetical protein
LYSRGCCAPYVTFHFLFHPAHAKLSEFELRENASSFGCKRKKKNELGRRVDAGSRTPSCCLNHDVTHLIIAAVNRTPRPIPSLPVPLNIVHYLLLMKKKIRWRRTFGCRESNPVLLLLLVANFLDRSSRAPYTTSYFFSSSVPRYMLLSLCL